ncbi:MAG: hypothetical protein PVF27_05135 [Gemmatimonadales bacterium]|jgi:hypothetical protein
MLGLVAATAGGHAQTARELQGQALAVVSGAEFVGGGVGVALRPPGRSRIGVSVSGGVADGITAGRAEVLISYHVNPYARRGIAPYAFGGVALQATRDTHREHLVLGVGVETAPGGRWGLFVEASAGGGLRLSAGLRLRRR